MSHSMVVIARAINAFWKKVMLDVLPNYTMSGEKLRKAIWSDREKTRNQRGEKPNAA